MISSYADWDHIDEHVTRLLRADHLMRSADRASLGVPWEDVVRIVG